MGLFKKYCEHVVRQADPRIGVVNWLLGSGTDVRKTGRTHLMALAFVRQAALSPGRWVKVWDHHDPDRTGKRLMMETVRSLFPTGLELRDSAVMAHERWTRNSRACGTVPRSIFHRALVEDVRATIRAVLYLGVPPENVEEAIREELVRYVMEV